MEHTKSKMNQNNCVPLEILEQYAEYFNKQEGRSYPCSNQTVICGIVTKDKNKALSIMAKRGAIIKRQSSKHIEWELNNERWLWKDWNMNYRGYRFYKVAIDKFIDADLFEHIKCLCSLYCCSMEIV